MKKKITIFFAIVIILLGLFGLTGCNLLENNDNKEENKVEVQEENSLDGLAVYQEEEDANYKLCEDMEGITFKCPSNYTSVGKSSSQPIYMDPDVSGASVNVVSENMPSMLSFEGYIEASKTSVKNQSQMTILGDITTEYINLNGVKAAKLIYQAKQSNMELDITQIVLEKEGKVYVFSLGGLTKDREVLAPKFDKIIKSIK